MLHLLVDSTAIEQENQYEKVYCQPLLNNQIKKLSSQKISLSPNRVILKVYITNLEFTIIYFL